MRVLFLAAEATPFVKVGGLADVAGELPAALRARGMDVRLVLPLHRAIDRRSLSLHHVADVIVHGRVDEVPGTAFVAGADDGPVYLIDGDLIRSAADVYGEPEADAAKFAFFCLAALETCESIQWKPDVVHAQDWHAAPAVVWLARMGKRSDFWRGVGSVLTVHNLPFMGAGGAAGLSTFGIDPTEDARLPIWARPLPLPLGLAHADWITTVSPSYALEIQTPPFGCGLDPLLRERSDHLVGILNGLDPGVWDPAADPSLPVHFSRRDLSLRAQVKQYLQSELDLPGEPCVPVLGMVTRLDTQKGVDLALAALEAVLDLPWQLVLLGKGDTALTAASAAFAAAHPERCRFLEGYAPQLASRIYAGADMLLVPSRYEPCGLTQMIALRYGCVPVVRATGGLRDTVVDCAGAAGTGFLIEEATAESLASALRRALEVYADQRRWRGLQRRGMAQDFSWSRSAERYEQVYAAAAREARERAGVTA